MDNEEVLTGVLIAAALLVLALGAYTSFVQPAVPAAGALVPSSAEYTRALAAQLPNDKCATPPGYADQSWRDHMSHHPDQYRECLNG